MKTHHKNYTTSNPDIQKYHPLFRRLVETIMPPNYNLTKLKGSSMQDQENLYQKILASTFYDIAGDMPNKGMRQFILRIAQVFEEEKNNDQRANMLINLAKEAGNKKRLAKVNASTLADASGTICVLAAIIIFFSLGANQYARHASGVDVRILLLGICFGGLGYFVSRMELKSLSKMWFYGALEEALSRGNLVNTLYSEHMQYTCDALLIGLRNGSIPPSKRYALNAWQRIPPSLFCD